MEGSAAKDCSGIRLRYTRSEGNVIFNRCSGIRQGAGQIQQASERRTYAYCNLPLVKRDGLLRTGRVRSGWMAALEAFKTRSFLRHDGAGTAFKVAHDYLFRRHLSIEQYYRSIKNPEDIVLRVFLFHSQIYSLVCLCCSFFFQLIICSDHYFNPAVGSSSCFSSIVCNWFRETFTQRT